MASISPEDSDKKIKKKKNNADFSFARPKKKENNLDLQARLQKLIFTQLFIVNSMGQWHNFTFLDLEKIFKFKSFVQILRLNGQSSSKVISYYL